MVRVSGDGDGEKDEAVRAERPEVVMMRETGADGSIQAKSLKSRGFEGSADSKRREEAAASSPFGEKSDGDPGLDRVLTRSNTLKARAREKLQQRQAKRRRKSVAVTSPRPPAAKPKENFPRRDRRKNPLLSPRKQRKTAISASGLREAVMSSGVDDVSELFSKDSPFLNVFDNSKEVQAAIRDAEDRLNRFKDAYGKHQQASVSRQTAKLQKELKQLNAQLDQERREREGAKETLQKLREKQKASADANQRMLSDAWEIERNFEVEKIARLRLEMNDLKEKKSMIDAVYEKRALELACIDDEKKLRSRTNEQILQELLERADHLREELNSGMYDEQTRQSFAKAMIEEGHGNQNDDIDSKGGFSLAKAVEAERKNRYDAESSKRMLDIYNLNMKRMEIDQRLQELARNRKIHDVLTSKGSDFLVEVELGNAPPLDILLRNVDEQGEDLDIEGHLDDGGEDTMDMDEFINLVRSRVGKREARLKDMKQDFEESAKEGQVAPRADSTATEAYDGSLGAASYESDRLPAFILCRSIVLRTVDEFLSSSHVVNLEEQLSQAKADYEKWDASRKMLKARMDECRQEKVMRAFAEDVLLEAVAEAAADASAEIATVDEWCKSLSNEILVNSAASLSGSIRNARLYPQLGGLLKQMQTARAKRDELPRNQTRVKLPVSAPSLEERNDTDGTPSDLEDARTKSPLPDTKALNIDEDADILAVALLPVLVCQSKTSHPNRARSRRGTAIASQSAVSAFEDAYWSGLRGSAPANFRANETAKMLKTTISAKVKTIDSGPACCIAISRDGSCVACGTAKGAVLMWTFSVEEAAIGSARKLAAEYLCSWIPPAAAERVPVLRMRFGLSRAGIELVTVDKSNVVRILHLRAPKPSNERQPDLAKVMTHISGNVPGKPDSRTNARRSAQVAALHGEKSSKANAKEKKTRKSKEKRTKPAPMSLSLRCSLKSVDFARPRTQGELDLEREELVSAKKRSLLSRMFGRRRRMKGIANEVCMQYGTQYERSLRPTLALFHPRLDPELRMQPSVVVALSSAAISKWNNPPVTGAWDQSSGSLRSKGWVSAAISEPPNPYHGHARAGKAGSSKNEEGDGGETTPRATMRVKGDGKIEREFFRAHPNSVVYMDFFCTSRGVLAMCSVDRGNNVHVWPYDPDSFSGFGWFEPSSKLHLDIRIAEFKPVADAFAMTRFPPDDLQVPQHPERDAEYLRRAAEEEDIIDSLDINAEPWQVACVADGTQVTHHAPLSYAAGDASSHHILYHSKEGVLLKHETKEFEHIFYDGILAGCQVLPGTRELAMLCVYPDYGPPVRKGARKVPLRARLFLLGLDTKQMRRVSFEIEISVTPALHRACLQAARKPSAKMPSIPFAVSGVVDATGCDYLFVANGGVVALYSLGTGTLIHEGIRPMPIKKKSKPTPSAALPCIRRLAVCGGRGMGGGKPRLVGLVGESNTLVAFDFSGDEVADRNDNGMKGTPRWRCAWDDDSCAMRSRRIVMNIVEDTLDIVSFQVSKSGQIVEGDDA